MMSWKGKIGEIVEMRRIRTEELWIEWRIRDFSSLSTTRLDYYNSPDFMFDNERWHLALYLNHPNPGLFQTASEWVKLCIFRNDDDVNPTGAINVGVGIKGSKGIEKENAVEWEREKYGRFEGYTYLCLRSELSRQMFRLLPRGVLTLTCVMQGNVDPSVQDTSSPRGRILERVLTIEKDSAVKKGGKKANEDFAKLLTTGENSDITIQVGEVEFSVHRAILSARSPVLSAMFQHNTSERMSNKIIIQDCEPDIFKDFLHYIYAGSVESLAEEDVSALYRVADKYLADDLKLQCLEHLESTLSVQKFCDIVKFALTHKERDLLEQATDFASKNIRSIIRTEEWLCFMREFTAEANEILVKSLGPPS